MLETQGRASWGLKGIVELRGTGAQPFPPRQSVLPARAYRGLPAASTAGAWNWRAGGIGRLEAMALGGVGDAEYMRGRMISAREGFRRCIELARQQGLGRIEVANWPMAALTRWYTGDLAGALDDALAAIAAAAKVGHQRAEIIGHHAAYFCRREVGGGAGSHVERR